MKTSEKLKIFAKKKFGSLGKLADALGVKQSSLSQYVSGKYLPGNSMQSRLRDLGCDINWLMSEDDEPMPDDTMYESNGKPYRASLEHINRMIREAYGKKLDNFIQMNYGGSCAEAAKRIGISEELLKQYTSGRKSTVEIWDKLQKAGYDMYYLEEGKLSQIIKTSRPADDRFTYFPVVNKVQGGTPSLIYREDNIIDYRTARYKKETNCFLVVVEGDSMDAGDRPIRDGDYALVDMDIAVMPGDLVVVSVSGRQMIKQFVKTNGAISLRSYKCEKYNDIPVSPSEIEMMYKVVRIVPADFDP